MRFEMMNLLCGQWQQKPQWIETLGQVPEIGSFSFLQFCLAD